MSLEDAARVLLNRSVVKADARRFEGIAASVGLTVAPDWAGRPSLTHEDAVKLWAEWERRRQLAREEASTVTPPVQHLRSKVLVDGKWV